MLGATGKNCQASPKRIVADTRSLTEILTWIGNNRDKNRRMRAVFFSVSFSISAALGFADDLTPPAQLKSEIPPAFTPKTESFDYVRRTAMIPMRDGVKLYTVILIPRGARRAPILLTRTPYDADERITQQPSMHLSTVMGSKDVVEELVLNDGYIRVFQDIRGKTTQKGIMS
jgi:uncharacterized protein